MRLVLLHPRTETGSYRNVVWRVSLEWKNIINIRHESYINAPFDSITCSNFLTSRMTNWQLVKVTKFLIV